MAATLHERRCTILESDRLTVASCLPRGQRLCNRKGGNHNEDLQPFSDYASSAGASS